MTRFAPSRPVRRAGIAAAWIAASLVAACSRLPVVGSAGLQAPSDDAPLVGFLVEDGVFGSDLIAPLDVLHHTAGSAPPGFRACTIGRTRAPIRTHEGLSITPDHGYDDAPALDVIVAPSSERVASESFDDEPLVAFVRERASDAKFVLAFGDGAFVLANAGLLDEKTCTARPADSAKLRERFAKADVVDNVSFAVDGKVITAVGGARSYDAALYLVERLYGSEPARAVARGLSLEWDLKAVPHVIADRVGDDRAWRLGEAIDGEVFVETAAGSKRRLLDLPSADDRVVVLIVFGGAARTNEPPRAGLWCEDSLGELGMLRHAIARFSKQGVCFVPVACPPLHHETKFGFRKGAFRPGGDAEERAAFASLCIARVTDGLLPFRELWFDFEYRLLRDLAKDPIASGEPEWVGRFRASGEAQEYGTPTIWILGRDGRVLAPPFHGNTFERVGVLRHTTRELEAAIARALEI